MPPARPVTAMTRAAAIVLALAIVGVWWVGFGTILSWMLRL